MQLLAEFIRVQQHIHSRNVSNTVVAKEMLGSVLEAAHGDCLCFTCAMTCVCVLAVKSGLGNKQEFDKQQSNRKGG